ncbi:MAG: bifunctional folylpolyglutamate synthase/dihydrofolate synthase [Coriobacteriia bacterium]|nr:bifunctional folylpolyglutamate synthase/dihydrofolate synthase [Coriobacteriia bacterium]
MTAMVACESSLDDCSANGAFDGVASYEDALAVLEQALVFGIDPSLEGITALCEALGNPQTNYPVIQVAGTNGKSSTARFTAGILRACGLRVGLYTSPELVYYEERIELDQSVISRADFARAVLVAHGAATKLIEEGRLALITEFELLTAAALWYFAQVQVEVAVLEVGMGGRWDATSVVDPAVAVVCGVGLDHIAILGSTLEEIAAEKAAIIKRGSIPVLGLGTQSASAVFEQRLKETGTHEAVVFVSAGDVAGLASRGVVMPGFLPPYQAENFACAVAAVEALLGKERALAAFAPAVLTPAKLSPAILNTALAKTPLPGRFETLRTDPLLIIDAAHNPQSALALAATLSHLQQEQQLDLSSTTLLLAVLEDKDGIGIIEALRPLFSRVAVTQTRSPRALDAHKLAALVAQNYHGEIAVFESVERALDTLTLETAAVIATGSITLAGEIKRLLAQ